ncbi:MAG: helicase C-terminal domain-containing protein [Burkholderiaceae bacterium]|nr:helicase C-terminal domain-containing protein [Burkholderiaceae bacterium]
MPQTDSSTYTVAVRALCEFTARTGDLDLRFTPSPTAQEGMQGHRLVGSRRNADYESELALCGDFGPLRVRGRADGYDPQLNRLEEIKTFRGDLGAMRANHRELHWAQARVYGALLCALRGLDALRVALVYVDVASGEETLIEETRTAQDLQGFFEAQCTLFLDWARSELAHRRERDAALEALAFPHADFRPGQRELAEAVYRSTGAGRCLMAQAPTGIGKTVGTLFPALKACAAQGLDKVFFLAARTPGRQIALDAAALIGRAAPLLPLRVLELVARDKACEHPDKACHGESCPLARGFYDRLPAARSAAVGLARSAAPTTPLLDRAGVRAIAAQHAVCPYYLAQDLARWVDLVVGDYNYYFDTSAMLYSLTMTQQWKVAVLVDEAHNMVERARSMYSASLSLSQLHGARAAAPRALKPVLGRLQRCWEELQGEQTEVYRVFDEVPARLRLALQQAGSALIDHLAAQAVPLEGALQSFYFEVLHFQRMADQLDAHSLFDITLDALPPHEGGSTLCLRNVVPAHFLKPRFAAAHSTVLFSATLRPHAYYGDILGLPANTAWIDVQSPFDAAQLSVRVASHISTRYGHRQASLAPMVELIASQYREQPGNYLAFLSSYDYLDQLAQLFARQHPEVPVWLQARGMAEAERDTFLANFRPEGRGLGFAVLGGSFAEGIDLPGSRLIGAFIATLGLPQVNAVNEQIKARMGEIFGTGYDYAYLYPGLQKVVQAAGRVIRTGTDQGVVHLLDDRFTRPEVRALLPAWWDLRTTAAARPQPATA